MRQYRLLVVSVVLPAFTACSPLTLLNATVGKDEFSSISAVRFGTEIRQELDVYVPKIRTSPSPMVIFFYGGSWQGGKRADYLFVANALASRGYVVVVPDYRVFPDSQFPDFVEDGAKAVRWSLDNAANFGGDPDQLYLMGHSAGAHLAAMLTLNDRYLAAENIPLDRIRGTIALAGPYAFYPSQTRSIAPVFANLADENEARPIVFVGGNEPPMLLLHGQDDETVLVANTLNLSEAIQQAGGSASYVIYPNTGHIGIVLALARRFRHIAPVLNDTAAFIEARRSSSAIVQPSAARR